MNEFAQNSVCWASRTINIHACIHMSRAMSSAQADSVQRQRHGRKRRASGKWSAVLVPTPTRLLSLVQRRRRWHCRKASASSGSSAGRSRLSDVWRNADGQPKCLQVPLYMPGWLSQVGSAQVEPGIPVLQAQPLYPIHSDGTIGSCWSELLAACESRRLRLK